MKPSHLILAIGALFFSACASVPQQPVNEATEQPVLEDIRPPALAFRAEGGPVSAPASGTVQAIEDDFGGLKRVVIEVENRYWLGGELSNSRFQLVVGGATSLDVATGDAITGGQALGVLGPSGYLSARSQSLDPYLLRLSDSKPLNIQGSWWFSPDWMLPQRTNWLSFRQVPSFVQATEDFYTRWSQELEEGETPQGSTLHFFPELDRISVRMSLPALPELADRPAALGVVETQMYGLPGLYTHAVSLHEVQGYTVVMYWQDGFREYLSDETEPGQELQIYCSIFALDHDSKIIVVCAQDFTLESDEAVLKRRMDALSKKP